MTKICDESDGLVQVRHNSSALAMELHLSCTNPLKYDVTWPQHFNYLNKVMYISISGIQVYT